MDHASMALLIPFAPFVMVVAIVAVTTLGKVARHYMDWRLEMARRLGTGEEASLMATLQALRAEVAALKQRESEVILTFDSTLQRLDDRLKHLETRALGAGTTAPAPRGTELPAARVETAPTTTPR